MDYPADGVVDPRSNSIYLGQWHHFAGVYSSSDQLLTLVVDGIAVATESYAGPLLHTSDLYIGSAVFEPDQETFNGVIDEIRIWSVARTPEDIRSTMFTQLSGTESGLIAYWPLNEGAGQVAHDMTSNGNDGQLGASPGPDLLDPEWVVIDGWVPVEQSSWGQIKRAFR